MENYILNRKLVEIEKNKEYSFRIPTMFNTAASEFILEVSEEQLREDLYIELGIKNPAEPSPSNLKLVRTHMSSPVTRFRPKDLHEIDGKDYLLFSCKSNYTVQFALSIVD